MQMLTRGLLGLRLVYREEIQKEELRDNDIQPTRVKMRVQEG